MEGGSWGEPERKEELEREKNGSNEIERGMVIGTRTATSPILEPGPAHMEGERGQTDTNICWGGHREGECNKRRREMEVTEREREKERERGGGGRLREPAAGP